MNNQVTHNHLMPALNIHPGEILQEELIARGISQTDFAKIIKRPLRTINQVINGKAPITPRLAIEIAFVFETSAAMWLSMQQEYDLFLLNKKAEENAKDKFEITKRYQIFMLHQQEFKKKTLILA